MLELTKKQEMVLGTEWSSARTEITRGGKITDPGNEAGELGMNIRQNDSRAIPEGVCYNSIYMKVSWMILDKRP